MSNLPAQIQKQVNEAKALIEQHYGPKDPQVTDAPKDDVQKTDADPAPVVNASEQDPAPVSEQTAPVTQVTSAEDENSPTYAQRWRSLQGTYNVTKQKLDESAARIANLESLVSNIQNAQAAPAVAAPAATTLVTPEDANEYGADMVDFVKRTSKSEMAPLMQAMQQIQAQLAQLQGITPVVQQVVASQQQTAEERFFARLQARVSDWAAINDNPAFHQWLMTPDPMTDILPQTYLADAQAQGNVDRVVNIFNTWKQTQAGPKAEPIAQPTKASSQLERQVAPGRASAASAPPAQKTAKTYTGEDITKFYRDKLQGVYKNRPEEAAAIEADIFKAQREGRVVQRAVTN